MRRLDKKLVVSAVLFALGMAFVFADAPFFVGLPRLLLFLAAYLFAGAEVLIRAGKNIARGQIFDENFLMALASICAFLLGETPEAVAVMLFYRIGEEFEERAVLRSQKSIVALMDLRPEKVNLLIEGKPVEKSPEEVEVGALMLVRPGERVPLDGDVVEGVSSIDASALTGESMPYGVSEGDEVLAGAVNLNGLLVIRVKRVYGESAVAKILKLVQEAEANKAPAEKFITKFARIYTPVVVFGAAALAFLPPIFLSFFGAGSFAEFFSVWLSRALVFLVVSCPCALVISVPLAYFGGIGGASKQGILIKGGSVLEVLARAKTVVFDKTGTLTKGKIRVSEIRAQDGFSEDEVLRLAALAESASTHPIGVAIVSEYQARIGSGANGAIENLFLRDAEITETPGKGAIAQTGEGKIFAGSARLLEDFGIEYIPASAAAGTVVYIAKDSIFAGYILLADEVKTDAAAGISALKKIGVERLAMLTGDSEAAAAAVAKGLGIDDYRAGLLPEQKVEVFASIAANAPKKGTTLFVGDGINDAPVLALADAGIAMGGLGSDAALEAADAVLMTDEPSKLTAAIQIAKKTQGIAFQNIVFALAIKIALLVLGALGIAGMWAAVFGDVGVAFLAILNALRALKL